jgi:hypothetical protein
MKMRPRRNTVASPFPQTVERNHCDPQQTSPNDESCIRYPLWSLFLFSLKKDREHLISHLIRQNLSLSI